MNDFAYTLKEYELIIDKMSYEKRLIVEGKTDKYFFEILLDEFFNKRYGNSNEQIFIDDVDSMIQKNNEFQPFIKGVSGNRGKVESIHENVKNSNSPRYTNLVFFADRDFDNFTIYLEQQIQDDLGKHKVDGSMIWSRGHSIENYLFDFSILRQPLIMLSNRELFKDAIKIFERNFYQIMKLATAMSIALRECKKIDALKERFTWQLFFLDHSNNISLNLDELQKRICGKEISLEESQEIIAIYQQWYNKIDRENVDINILKWMCHGKVGIKFILEVYHSCINYVAMIKNQEHKKMKKTQEEETWQIANWWADKAVRNECLYPIEVLEKLCVINNGT